MTSAELDLFARLGRALAVLNILYRLGRPSGETELAQILRVTPLTARRYLRQLQAAGLVERGSYRYGYFINQRGIRFLGVPVQEPEFLDPGETESVSPEYATDSGPSDLMVQNPELTVQNSELTVEPESAPQPTVNPAPRTIKSSQGTVNSSSRTVNSARGLLSTGFNSALQIKSSEQQQQERETRAEKIRFKHLQAIRAAFQAAGLHWNRRTQKLARLQHITPDYITAHYLLLQKQGVAHSGGLLVSILESGEPAPPLNANRHLEGCKCCDCRHLAYASWRT